MSDLYSAQTTLLLHMEGANGSTTFLESGGKGMTLTRSGNAQISTAQSKWGSSSGYFDGTGDYLEASGKTFGTGDFTVEGWLYVPALALGAMLLDCRTADLDASGFVVYLKSTGVLTFGRGNPWTATEGTTPAAAATWHHLALTRSSGVVRGFLNGGLEFTVSGITTNFSSAPWRIGISRPASVVDAVYLQDVRVTLGIPRYLAAFTPPSAKLPDPDPILPRPRLARARRDMVDGGGHQIVGTVDEMGVAGAYRVRLFERRTGRCVRETWSAADGSYSFPYLAYRDQGYFAVAFDYGDNPLNAAIADLITPEPMP